MKRLHDAETTVSRRSVLKYAAAMGASLVMPAGVAKAVDNKTSPDGEIAIDPDPGIPEDLAAYSPAELLQLASDNATLAFRDDFAWVAKAWSQDRLLTRWVGRADWWAARQAMQTAMYTTLAADSASDVYAASHAQFVVWAIESHAAGYAPEQCRVEFLHINGKREPSLVCSLEGFAL